jgi:uncharacterized protein (DUF1697 family)
MDRIALLRGVNVSGHRQIAMADLLALFEDLKLAPAKTLLQSGNVAFTGTGKNDARLEGLLETETAKRFGIETDYFVRDAAALRKIVAANPFKREAQRDPGRLVVFFLKEQADPKTVSALKVSYAGPEVYEVAGKHAYVYYPQGQGHSKFKAPWFGTARNWNTVRKLLALLE